MTTYSSLSDDALYRLTRKKAGERPADAQSGEALVAELRALANEIRTRIEGRQNHDN